MLLIISAFNPATFGEAVCVCVPVYVNYVCMYVCMYVNVWDKVEISGFTVSFSKLPHLLEPPLRTGCGVVGRDGGAGVVVVIW